MKVYTAFTSENNFKILVIPISEITGPISKRLSLADNWWYKE